MRGGGRVAVNLYCSRADVNARLPPGAIVSPSGILASCLAASNVLTYDGHGLETDRDVTVRAGDGGTLSAPLAEGTTYYAIRLTNAAFKLAATAGGAAIDITSNGVSMIVTREPLYDDVIEFVSRWADGFFPGHGVPFAAPIHPLVRGVVADVSAKRILNANGADSAVVSAAEIAGKAILERHAGGVPLRASAVLTSTNKAVRDTAGTSTGDARGWGSGSLP